LLTPYGSIRSEHPGQAKREALIAFLQSQGLRYGYATYWNAGAISVLSAQQVRIRQILVSNGLPIPTRHLSSDRWYSPSAWEGETFMLLTKSEAQQVDWELLDRYRVKPSKALKFDDWEVFVFPSNLAKDLPYWDTIFSYTQSIPLTKYSPHHIGRYVASDGQPMLVAEKGEQGFLHFGPYLRIASGTYRARYEVQAEGDKDSDFGFADVTSDGGTIVYSYTRISRPGLHTYEVDFTVPSWKGDLEFRVSTSGIARVQLRKIEVTRISD
jgi:hypothetical protein